VTPKLWLYAGGVALVGGVIIAQQLRISALKLTVAQQETQAAEIQAAAESAARAAYQGQVIEATRRAEATQGILNAELTKRQALEADLSSARAAGVSLRNAARTAARRCAATASAADAAGSAPTGDPGVVFADVLGGLEARATALAELADRRGLAGATCEAERDALTTR